VRQTDREIERARQSETDRQIEIDRVRQADRESKTDRHRQTEPHHVIPAKGFSMYQLRESVLFFLFNVPI
jgi:hypothetical protein